MGFMSIRDINNDARQYSPYIISEKKNRAIPGYSVENNSESLFTLNTLALPFLSETEDSFLCRSSLTGRGSLWPLRMQ